jgi:hypothetical protein
VMSFFSKFDNKELISVQMPVERRKAIKGSYSTLVKDSKIAMANQSKVDKNSISVSVSIEERETDRLIISCPNGLSVNMPSDFTKTDLEIIQLHLQAKILSL